MNKYQEYLLKGSFNQSRFAFFSCCPLGEEKNGNFYGKYDRETDTFTITQDKNINLVEYALYIAKKEVPFEKVFVEKNGAWQEIIPENYQFPNYPVLSYRIIVDFCDRADKIRFHFIGDLADDYILKLQYVEADKEAYYAEQAKIARDNLLKTAAIKHSTGNDLVNIYFQPCCDEYQRTEITLYHDGQMIGKYKVDAETFFKSITGLAYGTYEYVLKQFGKDDKVLIESDKIEFTIKSAVSPYGGKGLVYWN